MIAEYDKLDAVAMADLVRRRELKAEELLDEAIARTEARDTVLNAVTTRFFDLARDRIAQGLPDGPLRGVPFLLKDLGVFYAGTKTTSASRLFAACSRRRFFSRKGRRPRRCRRRLPRRRQPARRWRPRCQSS